jgi:hypothetical protein
VLRASFFAAAASVLLSCAASAATLYENPYADYLDVNASCMFNTPCAALFDLLPSYGGQAFSLADAGVVRSASFTELDTAYLPTVIRWALHDADGPLAGSILRGRRSRALEFMGS